MPPLSKWTAPTGRRKTDENPTGAILFPLYNKAFKLLADSDIPALLSRRQRRYEEGEERVIDEPAEMSFRAEAGSEQSWRLGCKGSRLRTLALAVCPWPIVDSLPPRTVSASTSKRRKRINLWWTPLIPVCMFVHAFVFRSVPLFVCVFD